ncbi:MAG TPA: hypothetical protein VFR37_02760 [Longimicrobium sp.]|nr:hypothetical protein [Longimicrobium sp.]
MQYRHIARTLALSLALAACEGSTDSVPLDGVYVLQMVEGQPVPAAVDTQYWNDNVTYSVNRVMARSLEFLDRDSVVYTTAHQTVTYFSAADSAFSVGCTSAPVPYRVRNGRLLLIVEPALFGQQGRLRIDTLQVENDELVHNIRSEGGRPLRLEYAPASQPARCASPLP